MKSKEDMIKAMAESMFMEGSKPEFKFADAHHWTRAQYLRKAEAALKALCGALPKMTYTVRTISGYHGAMTNGIPCEAVDNGSELYDQLKQWGK